ncbi:hypothetical protein HDU76_011517, partial [Blyttiomyces sp. JEL0837]
MASLSVTFALWFGQVFASPVLNSPSAITAITTHIQPDQTSHFSTSIYLSLIKSTSNTSGVGHYFYTPTFPKPYIFIVPVDTAFNESYPHFFNITKKSFDHELLAYNINYINANSANAPPSIAPNLDSVTIGSKAYIQFMSVNISEKAPTSTIKYTFEFDTFANSWKTTLTSFAGRTSNVITSENVGNEIEVLYVDKVPVPPIGNFVEALHDDLNRTQPNLGDSSVIIQDLKDTGLLHNITHPQIHPSHSFKYIILVPKNYAESKSKTFPHYSIAQLRHLLQFHILLDYEPVPAIPKLYGHLYQLNTVTFPTLLNSENATSKIIDNTFDSVSIGFVSPGTNTTVKIIDG